MLKSTILPILAFTMPMAFAWTEEKACEFSTTNSIFCSSGQHDDSISDAGCFLLHRDMLYVKRIAPTCRVFIYENKDCTGKEKQVYSQKSECVDIEDYYSIKAVCH
ncbi:hypothetical protein B0J14DRAFT_606592 [Halenospora varia]|nr:hypothetical protein B0J14DRAFT_606592 [Halenospora varia]